MTRSVCVRSRPVKFFQNISIGHHMLQADEPTEAGGKDAGPNPYELLMAALGACKSMTVRMYAEQKHWPLQGVQVTLTHDKIHAADCVDCENKVGLVDRIAVEISFAGELTDEQRNRLLEISEKCPVHRTLTSQVQIESKMVRANTPSR